MTLCIGRVSVAVIAFTRVPWGAELPAWGEYKFPPTHEFFKRCNPFSRQDAMVAVAAISHQYDP